MANYKLALFSLIFDILGYRTDRCKLKNKVFFAEGRISFNDDMGFDPRPFTDLGLWTDNGRGSNPIGDEVMTPENTVVGNVAIHH